MKKCLLIMLVVFFAGCSKSDDEPKLDERMVGTKWQTEDFVYNLLNSGTAYSIYEFTSSNEVEGYTTKNGVVIDSKGTFSYTLNYPTLIITESKDAVYNFTFKDARTIVRTDASNENMPYMKYIKQ